MRKKFFYGWVIVGLSFLVFFVYEIHYVFGIFLDPLIDQFGWSREGLGWTGSIAAGLSIPVTIYCGKFFDKYGPRKLFAIIFVIAGAGLFLSSFVTQLWQLYITFGVIWGGVWFSFFTLPNAVVRRWFDRRAGLALGIAVCGIALGWPVLFPLVEHLIASGSWQHAFQVLGVIVWVIGAIVVAFIKPSPESIGSYPDGEKPEALFQEDDGSEAITSKIKEWTASMAIRTRSFWMTWLALFCVLVALTMVVFHGPSYATAQGIERATVVFIFGIMGLLSVLGRIGSGRLGDHLISRGMPSVHARRYMYAVSGLLMGIGMLIMLQLTGAGLLWVWAVVFGIGYGFHVPQLGAIMGDLFGRKNLGIIISLGGTAAGVAGIIGPPLAGRIYDVQGNYALAFQIAAGFCFATVIFSMLIEGHASGKE
jgi:MFS family permease